MPTIVDGHMSGAEPVSLPMMQDEPTCIFAALIDGLTGQERYTLEMRNCELYIEPTFARRAA